jgi:hypothetical protein
MVVASAHADVPDFHNLSEYPNTNVGAVVSLIPISGMAFPPDDITILT